MIVLNQCCNLNNESIDIFGFKQNTEERSWNLESWNKFMKIPGISESKIVLTEKSNIWVITIYVFNFGHVIQHSFQILNLVGAFSCIEMFVEEMCSCSDLDKVLISNFYKDKLMDVYHSLTGVIHIKKEE